MPTLSNQQRFWAIALAIICGIAIATATQALVMNKIIHDTELLSSARSQFEVSERERETLGSALQILEGLTNERSVIARSISDPVDPLPLIEAIEGLGRSAGVEVELALAGTEIPQSYTVNAEGAFPNVFLFFERLESLPFLIELGDVEISRMGALVSGGDPKESPPSGRVHGVTSFRSVKP